MTVEDKLFLRGQLLAEIESAEEGFAYQREKGFRLAAGLREVADRIELNGRLEPSNEDFAMEASLERGVPASFQTLFDFRDAVALLSDLKKCRQTLYNLRMRKSLLSGRGAINTL